MKMRTTIIMKNPLLKQWNCSKTMKFLNVHIIKHALMFSSKNKKSMGKLISHCVSNLFFLMLHQLKQTMLKEPLRLGYL